MSWYRRFKNRKNRPYYEITGSTIEKLIQEYFPENELYYSCRWRDYTFNNTTMRVLRRTPYEFALDETHQLFSSLLTKPDYYIELDYIRQELSWLRELLNDNQIIYTKEWFLESQRPVYFFMKYYNLYMKYFLENWKDGEIFSCFPIDPKFNEIYHTSEDPSKVVAGCEKRSKMWTKISGYSKHRIFGHQFAKIMNHKLEPLIHPRFKTRKVVDGKRYDT
jgi:hypothetical protein